jgi:hypothetical protein
MAPRTQEQLVNQMRIEEGSMEPTVNRLRLPGIGTLHLQDREEIAAVLINVLKAQKNIVEFKWVLGEYIELTSTPD